MTRLQSLEDPSQVPPATFGHAEAAEYAAFVRLRLARPDSVNRVLRARDLFVQAYPDLATWFQSPLAERVGRLDGEPPTRMTCRVSYEARAYLYFLALRGYARYDYAWIIAIRRPDLWSSVAVTALATDVNRLVEEARQLGYSDSARDRLEPLVARLYLHKPFAQVDCLREAEIDELADALQAFGARPDVGRFFGSLERYGEAVRQYRSSFHLLRVVLYHRGQIATEPRTFQPSPAPRPVLNPRMEAVAERYLAARRLVSRPRTVLRLEDALGRFVAWSAGEHPELESFAAVTREHVLAYARALDAMIGTRTQRPLSPLYKRGLLSALSVFFADVAAWQWDDVPRHPLLAVGDLPKLPHTH